MSKSFLDEPFFQHLPKEAQEDYKAMSSEELEEAVRNMRTAEDLSSLMLAALQTVGGPTAWTALALLSIKALHKMSTSETLDSQLEYYIDALRGGMKHYVNERGSGGSTVQ